MESKIKALIIETSSLQQHEENSDDETVEQWVTSFGAISDEVAYAILTEIQNKATAHAITKDYDDANPFTFISENRYITDKFYGIVIDTGASKFSTAGHLQYLAFNKILTTNLNTDTAGAITVQFGIGATPSIGSIVVQTSIGQITFHVVNADTPFYLMFKRYGLLKCLF